MILQLGVILRSSRKQCFSCGWKSRISLSLGVSKGQEKKERTSLLSNLFPIPCTPLPPTCSWLAFPILPYIFSPEGFFLKFPAIKSARYPGFGGASFELVVGEVVDGEESALLGLEGESDEVLEADRRERGDRGGGYWKIIALCRSRVRWVLWNILKGGDGYDLLVMNFMNPSFCRYLTRIYRIVEVGDVWLEERKGKEGKNGKDAIHFWRRGDTLWALAQPPGSLEPGVGALDFFEWTDWCKISLPSCFGVRGVASKRHGCYAVSGWVGGWLGGTLSWIFVFNTYLLLSCLQFPFILVGIWY